MNAAEFWARVDRSAGPEGCWPWVGCLDANGYGWLRWHGERSRAHRVALELDGRPVPAGWHGLHSCHFPRCCNPAHLRPGTHRENMQDRVQAGRRRLHRSLTVEERQAVRELRGVLSSVKVAAQFGVSTSWVRHLWAAAPAEAR